MAVASAGGVAGIGLVAVVKSTPDIPLGPEEELSGVQRPVAGTLLVTVAAVQADERLALVKEHSLD